MKLTNFLLMTLIFAWTFLVGALLFKGGVDQSGKLLYQSDFNAGITGPFESSISRSRYALIKSIVDHGRFDLSPQLASFSSPDISYYNGKYFSIFAPGVSFFAAPFYALGHIFGAPQLFSYVSILILACLNSVLVYLLVKKLTGAVVCAVFGGLIFFFCTNSVVYALTLTQHQLSVNLLLLACLNIFSPRSCKSNFFLGGVYGFAIITDVPNSLLLFPPVALAIVKTTSLIKIDRKRTLASLFGFTASFLVFLLAYGYYNHALTGSPLTIGQNLGRSVHFSKPYQISTAPVLENDPISTPFKTRLQSQGLWVLLLGSERGWLFYSPILFLAAVGIYLLQKNQPEKSTETAVLVSIIVINVVIYSMFGDPWGGWSYGARYLLPSAALASVFVAASLAYLRRSLPYLLIVSALGLYSAQVNLSGAVTTTIIPSRQEAAHLGSNFKYTSQKSVDLILKNQSGSLIYNWLLANKLPVIQYFIIVYVSVAATFVGVLALSVITKSHESR